MEAIFLDSTFKSVDTVDVFNSFIWTDRYNSFGNFELSIKPTSDYLSLLNESGYINIEESEHTMFIEDINIKTNIEDGNELIIKGRSLESMLDRRIIWDPDNYIGDFQMDGVYHILNVNIFGATPTSRQIPGFKFIITDDNYIENLTINEQFFGEIIYDVVSDLCFSRNVGFKIILDEEDPYEWFKFSLYMGKDRSFGQSSNPYVLFSPNSDNLINADYFKTNRFLKTIALIAGERGVANVQLTATAYTSSGTGLNRREIFLEPSNIKRQSPGTIITDSEYVEMLEEIGLKELSKMKVIELVDGEVDASLFSYGTDFNMGDIVQLEDAYGHLSTSRINEVIFSHDTSGFKILPIFETI